MNGQYPLFNLRPPDIHLALAQSIALGVAVIKLRMRQGHLYTLCHVFLACFILFAPTVLALPDVKAFARSHVPRPLDPGKVRRADLSLSLSPTSISLNPASITSEWSPEASALESANRNNTALQLGQYILTHANDECKATGGGCSMFNYTLTDCLTDSCACEDETTLAAMVCASCQPEENVVKVYNKYLEICKQEGMAQPSDTVVVTVPWLSAQPSPSPGGSVPSGGATTSGNVVLTVNDLPGAGSTVSNSVPGPSGVSGLSEPSPSPSGAAVNVIQTSIMESPSAPTLSPSASVPVQSGQPAGLLMGLYDPNANVQPSSSSALSPGGASGLPNANLLGLDVSPTASGGSSTAPSSSALRPATSGPASVVMPDPDAIANARVQALGEAAASRSESVSLPFATSPGALSASVRPPASLGSATLVSAAEVTLPAGGNTTALEKSTLALNAAIAFFSVEIDPKCDKDCGTWRSLSNVSAQ